LHKAALRSGVLTPRASRAPPDHRQCAHLPRTRSPSRTGKLISAARMSAVAWRKVAVFDPNPTMPPRTALIAPIVTSASNPISPNSFASSATRRAPPAEPLPRGANSSNDHYQRMSVSVVASARFEPANLSRTESGEERLALHKNHEGWAQAVRAMGDYGMTAVGAKRTSCGHAYSSSTSGVRLSMK